MQFNSKVININKTKAKLSKYKDIFENEWKEIKTNDFSWTMQNELIENEENWFV